MSPSPIGMIAALNPERVIGVGLDIPWRYSEDFKRFKRLTLNSTVIMGRKTYESMGKPLKKRRNLVVTRQTIPEVECFRSLKAALDSSEGPVWLIGGYSIYQEGLQYADFIDLTHVPDSVEAPSEQMVYFPEFDQSIFVPGPPEPLEGREELSTRRYIRRAATS